MAFTRPKRSSGGWRGIPASRCSSCRPTAHKRTRLKNAQQTTPGTRGKRNQVQVTYPHHPLSGQTVEVIRPYSKEGQSYWDIVLPDGTRAFVPESWTRSEEDALLLTPRELDVRAVLALARMVADLQADRGQRGVPGDEHAIPSVAAVSARAPTAVPAAVGRSQSQAPARSSGGQP